MYHILVAEDERIERMALVKVLSDALGEGYAIHEAENGRQAVELFRQHPIGVAILDIEMPVMSGNRHRPDHPQRGARLRHPVFDRL